MGMSYSTWLVLPVTRLRCGSGLEVESLMLNIDALSIAIRETGVPHQLTENDIYRGYFMPEDATVMFNVWFVNFSSPLSSRRISFSPWCWIASAQGYHEERRAIPGTGTVYAREVFGKDGL